MKQVDLFNEFLNEVVNLNQTRVNALEDSIEAIKSAVKDSSWTPKVQDWMPQGSWAHKTIIKPVDQGEFDADLIVFVSPVDDWSAARYIDELYSAFRENGTYKDKVRRFSHCVTITYANDRKIDIAPCVVNRGGLVRLEVCNRTSDNFEQSEPRQYTDWLIEKNGFSGSNSFRKVTRLIKYLRDIKTTFTCSSVLLTTILGYRIAALDKGTDAFSDTPTALKTIFGRLDDWLQLHPSKPAVTNPFLYSEDFATNWTGTQYANFRERVNTYRGWIDEAYDEQDRNESIAKWRRVFGDDFAKDAVADDAKSISKSAVSRLKESVSAAALFAGDLVDAVKRFGVQALPLGFNKRPYMKSPTWRKATTGTFAVYVNAALYQSKGYNRLRSVNSLDPVPIGNWLEFSAVTSQGLPPSNADYRVEWRVTNTDEAAYNAHALRGDFYPSEGRQTRFEQLSYRGIHLVEAFVIRKRDERQVAQSEPFRVLIEWPSMPLTVADAFEEFLPTLTTSQTETKTAASHRASIEARLQTDFQMKTLFRTGSFGAGTNVRKYSDVDYFAVIPPTVLKSDSGKTLTAVANSMRARFPLTPNIRVNGPGVQIPFGDEGAEWVEVIPVDETGKTKLGFRQFDMPDGAGGWKFSAPESHKAYVDMIDRKLGGKVKPLIRFVKAWKFYRNVPIRSFFLEMKVAAYADNEQSILYDIDIKNVLSALWDDQLSDFADPRFPNDNFMLSACTSATSKTDALSKLSNAATWSKKAVSEGHAERPAAAIAQWNLVYAGKFPAYGLL